MEEMRIKTICSLQTRKAMACAVYETAPTSLELKVQLAAPAHPYGSHVKKHDTRLLIGRIAFLTCGKSDTRHLIGLHRFANENLLCGFSVCKSQYVYYKYCWGSSVTNSKVILCSFFRFSMKFHLHTNKVQYIRPNFRHTAFRNLKRSGPILARC